MYCLIAIKKYGGNVVVAIVGWQELPIETTELVVRFVTEIQKGEVYEMHN